MSFEHAPVSKGLMVSLAISSILVGVFDVKHYFHLQLVPHISRHYQYWRLGAHHLAFSNSSDLFIAEILLYNIGIPIERQFGTLKFASFAVVTTLLATLLELIFLILFHRTGLNYIPSGPATLIFSLIYQYHRIVPSAYSFRIFGLPLTNKGFTYVFALQLAIGYLPGSAAAALIGLLAGQIYRSDLANLKGYRIPPWLASFASQYILPLLGSLRPARRSNRALPDDLDSDNTRPQNDEVITTARQAPAPSPATQRSRGESTQAERSGAGGSVVREWVEGLTGRTQTGIRIPTEAEIAQLTTMFPDIQRSVLVGTLQRSPNIESAVETLLSSQQ
ncbi:DSC E3 ubiquitin ligase complex subunit 2 [Mycena sanguinolenta]|uniref:DSC E3 ubiquitin ligase complex subunit 2 n=1 Tax=Mycena sanguinolenta TaxID=230812 RepID=A0A8H6X697_9AGAR|nr:DSC E3 ubiquitin ligase complex subunit 2 [Mycena sanguinolenta]